MLRELSELIRARTGLVFTQQSWPQLSKALADAAQELGIADPEELAQRLLSGRAGQETVDVLARYLTVGETYFYREPAALQVFAATMLPELIAERRHSTRHLRIWSAACCTGEEPYTLAMILRGVLPDWRDWNVSIQGTDINRDFLARARAGVYREWSFRGTTEAKRELYFTRDDSGQFHLRPDIKEMVQFSYLNLAAPDYPSPLNNTSNVDIIFCRNVLIYLSPETAAQVIRRFSSALVEGGWLVVSPSEASPTLFAAFETLTFPGTIIYRKPKAGTSLLAPRQSSNGKPATPPRTLKQPPSRPLPPRQPTGNGSSRPQAAAKAALPMPGEAVECAYRARRAADGGNLEEAVIWCRLAIEADKIQPRYHYLHATILLEQGRIEEAQAALRRVLFLDPDFVAAYFALGNLALQGGRSGEARRHLGTVRRLLAGYPADGEVPELADMTVARLTQMVNGMIGSLEGGE